ncbi:hypothetical protein KI387_032095 [Taxus chinensis]|uniref:Exocyst component Exo84 C-terminal domain-containing protein n=1 Tax=Taxus chinensis TaxID=29808 RepID=A0AA38F371_TAXCH|nr:hypothetical protein KI387_032095 [Taxus chinensis]
MLTVMSNRAMEAADGHSSVEFGASAIENGGVEIDGDVVDSPASEANILTVDGEGDSKFQSMTEKGIRHLCLELLDLKKASAEELQRNVYSNHSAFVRISQEVTDLERELVELKMHISQQGSLVRDMMDGICLEYFSSNTWTDMSPRSAYLDHACSPSELEHHIYHLSEVLGVLLSEHKEEEALSVLEAEDKYFHEVQQKENSSSSLLALYQSALFEWKGRLAEQFVQIVKQPRVRGTELQKVLSGLCKLGDGPRAHTLLLNSHHLCLHTKIQNLLPSSGIYSANYMTTLARIVFSTISLATKHSVEIFGEASAYTSELVLWARKETDNFVQLVKKHVLSFKERAGGLQSAVEWVQVAVGHCSLLEAQGIALCPYLLKLIQPCMEEVLAVYLKRIETSVSIVAANDDWVVTSSCVQNHLLDKHSNLPNIAGDLAAQLTLTSSAHKFISMVQDILEELAPIINLQSGQSIVDCIALLFSKYVDILVRAMPCPLEDEKNMRCNFNSKLNPAKTEAQQLALLASAAALADELLPHSISKFSILKNGNLDCLSDGSHMILRRNASHLLKCKDWKCLLKCSVDKLRDQFCQQYVLNLYSKEGDTQITALMYLNGNSEDLCWGQSPMPSSPFQAWFVKLTRLGQISIEMLHGRDRAASQLLMRLTETFVIWLANDQEFWDILEHSSPPLSPFKLHQFVLDMHFLVESAISGNYSSQLIQQMVSKMTHRAETAFSATTGKDPKSSMPKDAWFSATSQEAINKLLARQAQSSFGAEKPRFEEKHDDLGGQEHEEHLEREDDKYDGESDLELNKNYERYDHDNMLHQGPDLILHSPTSLRSEDSLE